MLEAALVLLESRRLMLAPCLGQTLRWGAGAVSAKSRRHCPSNLLCRLRIVPIHEILCRITLAESVCAAKYTFPGIFGGSAAARLFGYGLSGAGRFQQRQG
ncbi:hypothetical protein KL86PLE_90372 [uncultured Pleomorphomonas sp.]|uniref:Uncharacterized protein n=1 Tax=uncultured Pleomorphomonas sp. TaxID=442121 RepID=A0A212LPE0_9HYPH|nr:hypothetical protein KL86PLE_90372 [uncultured Pleomorphomonas sp.]